MSIGKAIDRAEAARKRAKDSAGAAKAMREHAEEKIKKGIKNGKPLSPQEIADLSRAVRRNEEEWRRWAGEAEKAWADVWKLIAQAELSAKKKPSRKSSPA